MSLRNKYRPQKAQPKDKSAVQKLLDSCQLPYKDLTTDHLEHFLLIKNGNDLLGVVGLELYGEQGLLRSLAVREDMRNAGVGNLLVKEIEYYAQKAGVKTMYLLTTTADAFFANQGYTEIDRENIPESVRQSEEYSSICPTTALTMSKMICN